MSTIAISPVVAPAREHDRRGFARSAVVLSVALTIANAASYLIAVVGSHRLSVSAYGEFGTLLALVAIVTIPGLAVQQVVAREAALGRIDVARSLQLGLGVGVVTSVATILLAPAVRPFLHVHGVGGILAAFSVALPWTVLCSVKGWLQGKAQIDKLSAVVLLAGLARFFGGVVPLFLTHRATPALLGLGLASAVIAVVSALWILPHRDSAKSLQFKGFWLSSVWQAGLGLGGLLLLSNLDLLLARHVLGSTASGRYAAATVIARVALWLPQAIALTVLPKLTGASTRVAALRDAAVVTAAIGLLGVVVCSVFGGLLMSKTFGASYRPLGHEAWLFALQGSALALTQLLVVDDIARGKSRVLRLIAGAIVIEAVVVAIARPGSVEPMIGIACAIAVALALLAGRRAVLASATPSAVPDPH